MRPSKERLAEIRALAVIRGMGKSSFVPELLAEIDALSAALRERGATIRDLQMALWRFTNSSGTWGGVFKFCWCEQATPPDDAHDQRCQECRKADAEAGAALSPKEGV